MVFLTLGVFLGVFVLALGDHAQNGFFDANEWWAIASIALAGGLPAGALHGRRAAFIGISFGVLAPQAAVSLSSFDFHVSDDINGLPASISENLVHGALTFAQLLFVDFGVLAAIGLSAHRPPENGAERGTRTPKGLLPLAPQASASAKFRHLRMPNFISSGPAGRRRPRPGPYS